MGWCLFFWYFCFLVAFQRLLGSSFVFTGMSTATHTLQRWPSRQPVAFLILAPIVWLALYQTLNPAAEALVAALPDLSAAAGRLLLAVVQGRAA